MPESRMATISKVVATGRRMNGREGLIQPSPLQDARAPRVHERHHSAPFFQRLSRFPSSLPASPPLSALASPPLFQRRSPPSSLPFSPALWTPAAFSSPPFSATSSPPFFRRPPFFLPESL